MAPQPLTPLRQVLTTRLTLSELQILCFDLGLEYENLAGDTRESKVVALLKALVQRNQLDNLRTIGAALRPDIPWNGLWNSTPSESTSHTPIRYLPFDLPAGYVARPTALQKLRIALLQPQAYAGVVAATAVHGEGGLGKTILARAICEDRAIQQRYSDGVLWATLGQNADPARHQRNWIGALGGDVAAASDLERGKVELQRLLNNRAMLLILDDIWHSQDAEPLQISALNCGVFLTTRDAAQAHGAIPIRLGVMTLDESLMLLRTASRGRQLNDILAEQLASRLGYLPLALQIVGALLASGLTCNDIMEALNAGDLAFLAHGQRSVLTAIQTSVTRLDSDEAARYHELVIFPRAEALNIAAVARLWAQTANLKPYHTKRLLARFRERTLLQANNILHDLHVDYLLAVVSPTATIHLHGTFVDTYGTTSAWAVLPDDDGHYGWRQLSTHLSQAGRHQDLHTLLTNATYLQSKIARLGTAALLDDFRLLPHDATLQAIAGAVRLGAHTLDRTPPELANQLCGRLGNLAMLHTLPSVDGPYIRICSRSLTPPGGPLLRTLVGHTDRVSACSFSPNGRYVLSASEDCTLRLWNVQSGQPLHLLQGHTDWIRACSFSPNSTLALSASSDHTLYLWDTKSGQPIHLLEGHMDRVITCSFSPDGHYALSASQDRTLRVWDVQNGQSLHLLQGHTAVVNTCIFSPDGKLALSASDDTTLRVWCVQSGQLLHMLQGHTAAVRACCFSPDGKLALSASTDRTLFLWEVASGQPLHRLQGHISAVNACSFSPDGMLALSASSDRTLLLWEVASGQPLHRLQGHTGWVNACAFSPNGTLILSASSDRTLRLWDTNGGKLLHLLQGHTDWVRACTFSPDGRFALSASYDATLRLWDSNSGQPLHHLQGHTDWVNACTFSPDGQLALSASDDTTLRLWDANNGQQLHYLQGHRDRVNTCIFSLDSKLVLSASDDTTLLLWDIQTGQPVHHLQGHTDWVRACSFSLDGTNILSTSDDTTLRLWETNSGQLLHLLQGHTDWVRACSFSPDGRNALSASSDGTLHLWDTKTGQSIRHLQGHSKEVRACSFSPDGTLILNASDDTTLRLWDTNSGQPLHRLQGHTAVVRACAFSPNGRFILSASDDTTLRLWDTNSGQPLHCLQGHTAAVRACAFSPDGHSILSASYDTTLRLWDMARGVEIARWHADAPLLCCAFHPDGRHIIAGDQSGAVHFLELLLP